MLAAAVREPTAARVIRAPAVSAAGPAGSVPARATSSAASAQVQVGRTVLSHAPPREWSESAAPSSSAYVPVAASTPNRYAAPTNNSASQLPGTVGVLIPAPRVMTGRNLNREEMQAAGLIGVRQAPDGYPLTPTRGVVPHYSPQVATPATTVAIGQETFGETGLEPKLLRKPVTLEARHIMVPGQERTQASASIADFVPARVPQNMDEVQRLRDEQLERQPGRRTGSVRAAVEAPCSPATATPGRASDELVRRNQELEDQVRELQHKVDESREELLNSEAKQHSELAKSAALKQQLVASQEQVKSATAQSAAAKAQLEEQANRVKADSDKVARDKDLELSHAKGLNAELQNQLKEAVDRHSEAEQRLSQEQIVTDKLSRQLGALEMQVGSAVTSSEETLRLQAERDELRNQVLVLEEAVNAAGGRERELTAELQQLDADMQQFGTVQAERDELRSNVLALEEAVQIAAEREQAFTVELQQLQQIAAEREQIAAEREQAFTVELQQLQQSGAVPQQSGAAFEAERDELRSTVLALEEAVQIAAEREQALTVELQQLQQIAAEREQIAAEREQAFMVELQQLQQSGAVQQSGAAFEDERNELQNRIALLEQAAQSAADREQAATMQLQKLEQEQVARSASPTRSPPRLTSPAKPADLETLQEYCMDLECQLQDAKQSRQESQARDAEKDAQLQELRAQVERAEQEARFAAAEPISPGVKQRRGVTEKVLQWLPNLHKSKSSLQRQLSGGTSEKLFEAVTKDDVDGLKASLASSQQDDPVDLVLHTRNDQKQTLLHVALANGATEAARFILGEGQRFASNREYHFELIAELLKREATGFVNSVDITGRSPLATLCTLKDPPKEDVFVALMESQADPMQRDSSGSTPFLECARSGNLGLMRFLLELTRGKVMLDTDENYRSAIHIGAEHDQKDVVNLLMKVKADTDNADGDGRSPLEIAEACGHEALVKLLRDGPEAEKDDDDDDDEDDDAGGPPRRFGSKRPNKPTESAENADADDDDFKAMFSKAYAQGMERPTVPEGDISDWPVQEPGDSDEQSASKDGFPGRPQPGGMLRSDDGQPPQYRTGSFGPDGQPLQYMVGPDGQPVLISNDPDGVAAAMMSGLSPSREGMPLDGMLQGSSQPNSPEGRRDMMDMMGMLSQEDCQPCVDDDGQIMMGPFGPIMMGPNGPFMLGPEGPVPLDPNDLEDPGMMGMGQEGQIMMGPDGPVMMGPNGPVLLGQGPDEVMMGQGGQMMMGPDGQLMMGSGQVMMGPDGSLMMGPDGLMMGPNGLIMMGPPDGPVIGRQ